jgi:hypothetical protein
VTTSGGRRSDRASARRAGDLLRWAVGAVDDGRAPAGTTAGDRPPLPPPPPPAAGLADLTERAEYHRITPILHAVAGHIPDLDPTVGASLEASYHYAVRRHLFVLDDLAWVARVLGDLAPDVLVIKGPVLSSAVYARPDLRSYGDLDIVVRAQAFARAVELLTEAGATFCEPDWPTVVGRRHGEVALALPSGTVVDLHWHLIPLGTMRDRFTVVMATLFDRARTVSIDGRRYRTLAAEDTVVHLALHAVLCGGDRLGWLVDLDQALHPATGDAPDLDAVVSTARSWGAIGALASQLERLGRVLEPATAADATLRSTTARVARTATALADRIQPPERSTGSRTVGVALAWAAAPTLAASAVELTRMGARWARGQSDDHVHVDGRPTPPPTDRQWRDYLATVPSV